MLVPRVYGLGDLSQILDERAYVQARAILESLREDLAKVVVTDAYRKAAEALDQHSFVLLIGEPAAGKTTIASLLAMAALDQWQASMLKLDDPGKVAERWNRTSRHNFSGWTTRSASRNTRVPWSTAGTTSCRRSRR